MAGRGGSMKDVLKKGFFLGIGLASLTERELKKTVNILAKKGYLNTKEAKKFADELYRKAREQKQRIEALAGTEVKRHLHTHIKKHLHRHIKKLGVASQKELKSLKARVSALEKRLEREGRNRVRKMLRES
jgi:polyhydroxyalkanoate synthesis regulator phasin